MDVRDECIVDSYSVGRTGGSVMTTTTASVRVERLILLWFYLCVDEATEQCRRRDNAASVSLIHIMNALTTERGTSSWQ